MADDPLEGLKTQILTRLGISVSSQIVIQQGAEVDLDKYISTTPVPNLKTFIHVRYLREDRQRWCTALICQQGEEVGDHHRCDRMFKKWHNLFDHLRTHSLERPYVYSFQGCKNAFTQKSNLNKHMVLHQRTFVYRSPLQYKRPMRKSKKKTHFEIDHF